MPKFHYVQTNLQDIHVQVAMDKNAGRNVITEIEVCGHKARSSDRFWVSLYAKFGFNKAFNKYWSHAEIFERISQVEKDEIRVCIEEDDNGQLTVMAATGPEKPIVPYVAIDDLLTRYGASGVRYYNGIVHSIHEPRTPGRFKLAGDDYECRFQLATPIDGYGQPAIYLAIAKLPEMSYLVGVGQTFKSSLALGKGEDTPKPAIVRALESFGNDEGYAALRSRLVRASESWASVHETEALYRTLISLHANGSIDVVEPKDKSAAPADVLEQMGNSNWTRYRFSPVIGEYVRMVGDFAMRYGMANPDALSARRRKMMPMECTVYDMLLFIMKTASAHTDAAGSATLHSHAGSMLSDEFDLEGTKKQFPNFEDFAIRTKLKAGATGSEAAEKAAKLAS